MESDFVADVQTILTAAEMQVLGKSLGNARWAEQERLLMRNLPDASGHREATRIPPVAILVSRRAIQRNRVDEYDSNSERNT